MPKVSICIPAYKQTKYLSKLLDSILIQEYKDYEVIITDDSPGSSVVDLIEKYNFRGRLKYFRNKERKGTPANWNEAISFATGEYIKLVHHDDWFADSKSLQKYVALLDENPEADFAFSGCKNISENTETSYLISSENKVALKKSPFNLILGNIIGAPSVTIYRRCSHEDFDTKLKWLVDLDQYIRMLEKNPNFIYTIEILINICNKSVDQVTKYCQNNINVELPEYIYIYNKYNGKFTLDKNHKNLIFNLYDKYKLKNKNDLKSLRILSDIPELFIKTFSGLGSFKLKILKAEKILIKVLHRIKKIKFA